MYIKEAIGNTSILQTTFTNCEAQQGGAIYAVDVILTLISTLFISNSASYEAKKVATFGLPPLDNDEDPAELLPYASSNIETGYKTGGALLVKGISSESTVSDCVFNNNTATMGGAACVAGKLSIQNTSFRTNKANYFGGALYLDCSWTWCRADIKNS